MVSPGEREQRDFRATSLRLGGHTYEEIARQIGVANKSVAFKMVKRGLEGQLAAPTEDLFVLELLRLSCILGEIYRRLSLEIAGSPARSSVVRVAWEAVNLFWTLLNGRDGTVRPDLPQNIHLSSDLIDKIAEEFTLDQFGYYALLCARQAKKFERRRAGSAHSATGRQARRDQDAVRLRDQGTYEAIATEMGLANRSVAAKMVARGRNRTRDDQAQITTSEKLTDLRLQQLRLLEEVMTGDWVAHDWSGKVWSYLQITRERCRLLGMFPTPTRALQPS